MNCISDGDKVRVRGGQREMIVLSDNGGMVELWLDDKAEVISLPKSTLEHAPRLTDEEAAAQALTEAVAMQATLNGGEEPCGIEARKIVNRHGFDEFDAWQRAASAASIGWRVVAAFPVNGQICVWAEAPADADADDWDRAHRKEWGRDDGGDA